MAVYQADLIDRNNIGTVQIRHLYIQEDEVYPTLPHLPQRFDSTGSGTDELQKGIL